MQFDDQDAEREEASVGGNNNNLARVNIAAKHKASSRLSGSD
jgi:hypothetical protein